MEHHPPGAACAMTSSTDLKKSAAPQLRIFEFRGDAASLWRDQQSFHRP
jgi:hypothetical protein